MIIKSIISQLNDPTNKERFRYTDIEKEYLIPFLNEHNRTTEDIDLLFSFQSMYRRKIGWDRNVEAILSAAGFLCGKNKDLCNYLIQKIIKEKDGDAFRDSKYTYMYCLTIASLYSPVALKQILVFFNAMMKGRGISKLTKRERTLARSLYPDAQRGFWDAKRIFYKYGSASEATIKGLIKLIRTDSTKYHYDMAISILGLFLGEKHIVKCIDSTITFGSHGSIEKDFSSDVILMFRSNPPYYIGSFQINDEYHQILHSWCEHDQAFKRKLGDSFESIKPILLSRYLKSHKHHLAHEREQRVYDSLNNYGDYSDEEIEDKYASDEYLEFLAKCITNLDSKDKEARISEYKLWYDAARKYPRSVAKDAIDYINACIFEYPT